MASTSASPLAFTNEDINSCPIKSIEITVVGAKGIKRYGMFCRPLNKSVVQCVWGNNEDIDLCSEPAPGKGSPMYNTTFKMPLIDRRYISLRVRTDKSKKLVGHCVLDLHDFMSKEDTSFNIDAPLTWGEDNKPTGTLTVRVDLKTSVLPQALVVKN